MHAVSIVGLVFVAAGVILCFIAGIRYDPPIQRYLESTGITPSSFLFSWSGLRDYLNAKRNAKDWGHRPHFLRQYERLQIIALTLFGSGIVLAFVGVVLAD